MSKMPFWLKIGIFYLVTYVLTGLFFLLQVVTGIRGEYIQFAQMGPALAAVIFIVLERDSVSEFFRRGFKFSFDRFAIVMILVSIGVMALISVLTSGFLGVENFKSSNINVMSIYLTFSTIIAAMCEEIGWRGYFLSRLQQRLSPLKSSIIIGILWAFWHVPKLAMGLNYFTVWFFAILGLSIILTYVFNRTGGNIVVVTLIHSVINLMAYFFLNSMATDLRANMFNSIILMLWAMALIRFGKTHHKMNKDMPC